MKHAIRVENLSKSYRLGTRASGSYRTLRETITESVAGAWHGLRRRIGGAGNGAINDHRKDDAFWALKDVSFEVKPGEVVGIIGRNGAGKSTLLKVLSRIVEPTVGRCEVRGRMASLLEVGTGFHPELTGRENIYMNGSLLGMTRKEIERKFDEIASFSEIDQFLDTPVKRYSSGMYVRLAFAVAAHLQPEILVVDEVLAVGDIQFQKKCLGKMSEAGREGKTIVFVSHKLGAVSTLCSKCIWLDRGRIMKAGTTASVVQNYLTEMAGSAGGVKGHIDLRNRLRSPHFELKVKFVEIQLENQDGETTGSFGCGDPIKIRLTMESQVSHDHFIVGFSVRTAEGIVLYSSVSDDDGSFVSIRPGVIHMSCTMAPNYLKPGIYSLAIGNEVGTTQDYIEEAVSFEVQPNRHYSKTSLYNVRGHLHFQYKWLENKSTACLHQTGEGR
jgi:lipopolysaccharide transport system ATP-binding protein